MRRLPPLLLAAALSGCTAVHGPGTAATRQPGYPALLPLDAILADLPMPAPDPAAGLSGRAAALRARAAALAAAVP